MTRDKVFAALAVSLALVAALPHQSLAQGCAMCGTAVGDASDPLARSLASSVLFMLSMPFLLFFSVAGWIVYRHRRVATPREEGGEVVAGPSPEENPS